MMEAAACFMSENAFTFMHKLALWQFRVYDECDFGIKPSQM